MLETLGLHESLNKIVIKMKVAGNSPITPVTLNGLLLLLLSNKDLPIGSALPKYFFAAAEKLQ